MLHSTITSKGQITIPAQIRAMLKLEAGDKLSFIAQGDHITVIPINRSVTSLKGFLPKPVNALTIEEMNLVIKDSYDRS